MTSEGRWWGCFAVIGGKKFGRGLDLSLEGCRWCECFAVIGLVVAGLRKVGGAAIHTFYLLFWVCGRWLAGIVRSNPAGVWMSVSCDVVCCQLEVSFFTLVHYTVWCIGV